MGALLVACGDGGGPGSDAFSLNTPIPVGPLTITVAEAKRWPPGERDAFEYLLEFRGQELVPGRERVIVLVRPGGVDTLGKARQFLAVFDERFTLVDPAGARYPRVALMTALTYRFLRTTPP